MAVKEYLFIGQEFQRVGDGSGSACFGGRESAASLISAIRYQRRTEICSTRWLGKREAAKGKERAVVIQQW